MEQLHDLCSATGLKLACRRWDTISHLTYSHDEAALCGCQPHWPLQWHGTGKDNEFQIDEVDNNPVCPECLRLANRCDDPPNG